jgi:hypothetical protein
MTPQDLQDQITRLRSELGELTAQFYKNNFTSHQDFNKTCSFNTRLKVPSYSTLPTCEVGELAESSGVLYVCSATDTWTVVGTQI